MAEDGRFSHVVVAGCWFTLGSFIMILLSFCTPYWLETDGLLADARFVKLGLWTVCFNGFQDPRNFYDVVFTGCGWVLSEEYRIIDDVVRPRFFVWVQVLFTLGLMGSACCCAVITTLVCCATRQYEHAMLKLTWLLHLITGLLVTVSVLIFAVYGDSHDWMPDFLHNNLSWSFALGVSGGVVSLFGGVMYWVEARRHTKRSSRARSDKLPSYEPSSQV